MANDLQGATFTRGAASEPFLFTLTRPDADDDLPPAYQTTYDGTTARLLVWRASSLKSAAPPMANTAAVILTVGGGLTNVTNEPDAESGDPGYINPASTQKWLGQFTSAHLTTLLGADQRAQCRAQFWFTAPDRLETTARIFDGGYDALFWVVADGYQGVDPSTIKA
jgi:hypothetical protein